MCTQIQDDWVFFKKYFLYNFILFVEKVWKVNEMLNIPEFVGTLVKNSQIIITFSFSKQNCLQSCILEG